MKTVFEVAERLAAAHRERDPATTEIYVMEAPDEVRLVEVSGSVTPTGAREILPFRFNAQPDAGVDYPSLVVLLSPGEWEAVKRGKLELPSGWDQRKLRRVGTLSPESKQSIAARARDLQRRINERPPLPDIAEEAKRLFEDAEDDARTRWLALEINGYGELVSTKPLHDVLQVGAGSRLAAHVTAYRTQRGWDASASQIETRREFRHFFVESLGELVAARDRLDRSASGGSVLLDFGPQPGDPTYPTTGEFSRDVFDRILMGFEAALHLQLGDLVRD
jgi:hypothetical protein